MKKITIGITTLLLIFIAVYSCNKYLSGKLDDKINEDGKEVFDKINAISDIENTVIEINKKTPFSTGGGMQINSVEFIKDKNEVIYNYQNTEKSISELSNEDILNYKTEWRKNLLVTINNNPYNKSFVKAKIDFIYKLTDKNKIPILDFKIENKEYK